MGTQLVGYIMEAERISVQAKMKYVMLMAITTVQAAALPDEPALLEKASETLKAVRAEFG